MASIGLVGAGAMGSALGACWTAGGTPVRTCLAGRSERTRAMVQSTDLIIVSDLDEVVAADIVVSVVPPAAARQVAEDVGRAARRIGTRPVYLDLNAIAPTTVRGISDLLGLPVVDGSISGPPPSAHSVSTRVYLSGPRAAEVAAVPSPWLEVVCLGETVGTASALKMCTASMYKGTKALIMQAMLTAQAHGIQEELLADVGREWPEQVPNWHIDIAVAASKAWRFAEEMREVARTQDAAGLPRALFDGVAAAYERAAQTELGQSDPEAIDRSLARDAVLAGLNFPARPRQR